jgi:transcriptional regulator with XRE-family HTH domain
MTRKRTSRAVDPLVKALLIELDERGWTIARLSARAGLGKNTVSEWVQGRRVPNVGNMRAALDAVDLSLVAIKPLRRRARL